MERHLVITVDCDLRSDTVEVRQQTLDILLGIFEDGGASGKVTWFLNENHFFITDNHESFLREAARRGDTIGVHDHVDFLGGKQREAAIHSYCDRSLKVVKRWLKANGFSDHVPYHRMGCLYQREECYRALAQLGYTVVSDTYPGYKLGDHSGDASFDNRDMPDGTVPYRHGPAGFADCNSSSGQFLHFPVFHMFLYDLDFGKLARCIDVGEEAGHDHMPFVWCFHPYELCFRDEGSARNRLDPDMVQGLRDNIRRFQEEYGLQPSNLATCAEIFGG